MEGTQDELMAIAKDAQQAVLDAGADEVLVYYRMQIRKEKDRSQRGKTSHKEAVQIKFNPEVISYAELVDIFWQTYDPTDIGGSFFDRGTQYESAIFFHSAEQKKVAEESKSALDKAKNSQNPSQLPSSNTPISTLRRIITKITTKKIQPNTTPIELDRVEMLSSRHIGPNSAKIPTPKNQKNRSKKTLLTYNTKSPWRMQPSMHFKMNTTAIKKLEFTSASCREHRYLAAKTSTNLVRDGLAFPSPSMQG
ncbi:putative peptide methionine sulfoxide reductase MsrA-like [Daphnia sinensis]|uniref:peptide-methionine (S)-S-oxide reductase n=1 Tax=Daphnia sinensis TaxID=1820382 RepID=A0AAD5KTR2_9CRUS|nr:putative peptide methionine sulfoxide reductase MsrA-like [Daphnia sinensis]